MNVLRLLLVEDNEQERDLCKETATRYKSDKQCEVKIVECKCLDEAFEKLDNSFDAAIIDLKLENGGEGNQVLRRIAESSFRIPVAILTGTPDAVDADFDYIGVFKKGDKGAGYEDLLTHF